ncbi:MAG: bifunctional isocitrate dehydrogenase kinase/phosphatase [Rhizobiales bacterium]|nr:bifunctional isocitrate dehydrogenase kinase/phosphatase [Hyphomicrobiales bacterium]
MKDDCITAEGGVRAIVLSGLDGVRRASDPEARARALARLVHATFAEYYCRSRAIPALAKRAFEERRWKRSIELSKERISLYSEVLGETVSALPGDLTEGDEAMELWVGVEEEYRGIVSETYEADLALAYFGSLRRALHRHLWRVPVRQRRVAPTDRAAFLRVIEVGGAMTPELVEEVLRMPRIDVPFRDLGDDARLVAERINGELGISPDRPITRLEIVSEGFYRNRGAYIIGAVEVAGERRPLALALLNPKEGLEVDAVILRDTTLSHVFSSTLANFHVAIPWYHELVDYLFSLMPRRPRGQHYSTIGYNHVGKMAVMEQIVGAREQSWRPFVHAPGPRGSVAIAFTNDSLPFILKVIRDTPSDQYKWERYDGKESVLGKYRQVHEINRSGSMLDNIVYSNLMLPRELLSDTVLDELLKYAPSSVECRGEGVRLDHLIVQRKLVPVPLFLENCTPQEAETVVIRLGQCIRNNAAMNVFNRDLDGRNYGVSTLRFVYLFDYDAVDRLTDVKVRSDVDREPGEEDVPDWFMEEGTIFLPEELEAHLRLPTRELRRLFRDAHGELLTLDWWVKMQGWLAEGRVPRVRTYPRSDQLRRGERIDDLTLRPVE